MTAGFVFTLIALLYFPLDSSGIDSTKISSPVLELNDRFLDVKNDGNWLVEFYAPWCGHCKRLHPIWEQVGHELASMPVRVGRVDCTRFTDTASKMGIRGYPTIKFFRDGVVHEYDGDRTKDAIVDFAVKTLGPVVRYIRNVTEFSDVLRHDVWFLYVDGATENVKNTKLKESYVRAANKMFTKTYFFDVEVSQLPSNVTIKGTMPAVLVFKDGRYYEFDGGEDIEAWLNRERWSLLPEITHGNLYEMGNCCNRYLVLGILDLVLMKKVGHPVNKFYDLMKKTALLHYEELHRKFQFAWIDGNDLAKSILLGNVATPFLFVFNTTSYVYYLPEDSPEEMTEEAIALFLRQVEAENIPGHGGRGNVQKMKRAVYELYSAITGMFQNQPLLATCLFGLPVGILSVICYTLCSADTSVDPNDVYKDSDDEDEDDEGHPKND